jgi:hypothetical protein
MRLGRSLALPGTSPLFSESHKAIYKSGDAPIRTVTQNPFIAQDTGRD